MQNGAIWSHFRVSYNIESSTILMTLIDKNFLKSRDDKYMKGDITVYAFPIYIE
jgi:hypothetical protein